MIENLIEGQPFAGEIIGRGIYYHTCIGYYDNLTSYPNHGTKPCPGCGSDETDLVESSGGQFELYGYCHSCDLVWDSHNLQCECGNDEFEQDKSGTVGCPECGLNAPSIQDLLFRLVG